jgi:RND family efflux transporter MFP subunit
MQTESVKERGAVSTNEGKGRSQSTGMIATRRVICQASLLILIAFVALTSRSTKAVQGPGGEIKPKPSASPSPRQPTRVAPKPPRVSTPTPVKIAKVVAQTFAETISATGVVSAAETISVQSRVSGILAKISVQEGSAVKRGDLVAQIDNSEFRANEQQARSALAQAQGQAASFPAGSSKRAAAEEVVRLRIAQLNNAVAQLADCDISSPLDGVVRLMRVAQGQTVSVGALLMDIEATNQLLVHVDISNIKMFEVQIKQIAIRVGQSARVSDEQVSYDARVVRVTTAPANAQRITSVSLATIGKFADDPVHPGDRVRVEIDMDPTTVVTVPKDAVVKLARTNRVLVVENGRAIERLVTTGAVGTDWIEIRSGVKLGQSVIVDPKDLRSGQAVAVVN